MKRSIILLSLFLLFIMPGAASAEEKRTMLPIENSPSMGPENAPVTIIEFIDFQ